MRCNVIGADGWGVSGSLWKSRPAEDADAAGFVLRDVAKLLTQLPNLPKGKDGGRVAGIIANELDKERE